MKRAIRRGMARVQLATMTQDQRAELDRRIRSRQMIRERMNRARQESELWREVINGSDVHATSMMAISNFRESQKSMNRWAAVLATDLGTK